MARAGQTGISGSPDVAQATTASLPDPLNSAAIRGAASPNSGPEPTSAIDPPARLVADLIAFVTITMSIAGTAISMAVLVFAGPAAEALPRAAGSFVVAGGLMAMWVAARSRIVPAATIVQDGPAIVAAAVVGDFVGRSSGQLADVFVLLALTSLLTGTAMWLLGRFKLGGLVRYMPSTVISAFVAGTGWLLFKGGIEVMTGMSLGLEDVSGLFGSETLQFWLPGCVIGLVAWQIGRSDRLPAWAVGGVVLLALGGFYGVTVVGWSVAQAESGGWLIGPFPSSSGISLVSPAELADADWGSALPSLPGLGSVVALSIVALLLNLTGIGTQTATRVDVDTELRTAGIANILASPVGASPGFHAMGNTLLLYRLGTARRAVPIAAGAVMIALGVLGTSAVGYVPRIIPGIVLIAVGADLLDGWARGILRGSNRVEQLLSVAILLVIGFVGILPGIGAGVAAACAVFVVRYSRVDPVRNVATGRELRSRVDRSPPEAAWLTANAERRRVFQLQGYLFFGSMVTLETRLRDYVIDDANGVDTVIVDLQHVTGVDPSGYELMAGLFGELSDNGIATIVSSLDPQLNDVMAEALSGGPDHIANTLDYALELCEDIQIGMQPQTESAVDNPTLALSEELRAEFTLQVFTAGAVLMPQGSASDGLCIIDEGMLTVARIDERGQLHRLRRLGPLGIVGEIGVITGATRMAEVVADTAGSAYWLSIDRYRQLRSERPDLIIELHEYILQAQAERVVSLSDGLTRSLR